MVYFEKIKELSPKEERKYANIYQLASNILLLRGEKPSIKQKVDYAACLETFGFIPLNYEELEDFLGKKTFEEYIENAFKIDYASYKLAGGVGETEEIPEEFEIIFPVETHGKKIPIWKFILGASVILSAIGAGYYLYNNGIFDKIFKKESHSVSNYGQKSQGKIIPNNSSEENDSLKFGLTKIERYGLEKEISLNVSKMIEKSFNETDAKLLIDYLSKFSEHDYVPESIKDVAPENYQQKVYENIISKIAVEIVKDGNFSENEREVLEFLNDLEDSEVIKWYAFEKGFDEKTVEYLSYLSSLNDKTLAKYAASNLLFLKINN